MEVLIVKTGTTVDLAKARTAGEDFEHWFRRGLGLDAVSAPCVEVFREPDVFGALPDPETVPAVIVTGSPSMVTDEEPWSLATGEWLRRAVAAGCTIVGVCYGHQLLATALGGRVAVNPRGREIGSVVITTQPAASLQDPLFSALFDELHSGVREDGVAPLYAPDDGTVIAGRDGEQHRDPDECRYLVQESHSQSVVSLPPGARILAGNAHDPHQAVAYADHVWGVQFHPEFDGTVMRAYIEERSEALRFEGCDPVTALGDVRESIFGHRLLVTFLELARRREASPRPVSPTTGLMLQESLSVHLAEVTSSRVRESVLRALARPVLERKHLDELRNLIGLLEPFLGESLHAQVRAEVERIAADFEWRRSKHGKFVLRVRDWLEGFRDEFRARPEFRDVLIGTHSSKRVVVLAGRVDSKKQVKKLLAYVSSKDVPRGKVRSCVEVGPAVPPIDPVAKSDGVPAEDLPAGGAGDGVAEGGMQAQSLQPRLEGDLYVLDEASPTSVSNGVSGPDARPGP